ncbi:hypothetical protein BU26DRAFT_524080 [Trematosphaeria pertusa]|uniref:Conidiation protein 6 n=1 Tax=Trematosphaeria pertusa TaxID=390896 RepID=A0A6A6HYI8_9PLEO|nr:uncharacterized protein BU26DRAFT_524080 [Trematosphaeria pertusa]KAF2243121.1 hypothetical protein BU26DRAFT_524080 [Trematosphaeria pertusa]
MTDPANVAIGHKATITNPRTSEQAKDHSRKVLEEEHRDKLYEMQNEEIEANKNKTRVAGGLKAAVSNPLVSEEKKEEAKKKLEEM